MWAVLNSSQVSPAFAIFSTREVDPTIARVDSFAASVPEAPVLLISTSSPELTERSQDAVALRRVFVVGHVSARLPRLARVLALDVLHT